MPGSYGVPQMGCGREGQGRAAALPLCSGRVVARLRVVTQGPSGPFRPACAASSPKRGAFCGLSPEIIAAVKNRGGSGEHPTQRWRKGRGR